MTPQKYTHFPGRRVISVPVSDVSFLNRMSEKMRLMIVFCLDFQGHFRAKALRNRCCVVEILFSKRKVDETEMVL